MTGPARRVCDLCGASSSAERGTACRTCATGTMRLPGELQVIREQRRDARDANRSRAADDTHRRPAAVKEMIAHEQ